VGAVVAVDDEQHTGRAEATPANVAVAAADESVATPEHQVDGCSVVLGVSSVGGGVIDSVSPLISSTISGCPLSLVIVTGFTDLLRIAMPPPYRRVGQAGLMAVVVAVHGAFHELWGPHQVAGRWVPAMRDGLGFIGAPDIDPADVRLAFYGDLFRPAVGAELSDAELADIAARTGIAEAAEQLAGEDGIAALSKAIGQAQVNRTIAQLGRYFDDDALRAEVRRRVATAITAETRVVVAHSLGTVVAYEVLAAMDGPARLDLVTIGSPLGQHLVIGADLQPAPVDGAGRWPAPVRRWTNIAAIGDMVADGRPVAGVFAGVVERRVDNGHRAHDPEPYLCAVETARAIDAGIDR